MDRRLNSGVILFPLHGLHPRGVLLGFGCPSVTGQEASGSTNPGGDGPAECVPNMACEPRDEGYTRLLGGDLLTVSPPSDRLSLRLFLKDFNVYWKKYK